MALQTVSTTRKKASANARPKPRKGKDETESDIEVLDYSDDGQTFTARLFGDEHVFTFSTDMNSWLVMSLSSGDPKAAVDLVHGVLEVEEVDGEDIEVTRRKLKNEFDGLVGRQRGLGFERLFRFINDLIEAASGNETETS